MPRNHQTAAQLRTAARNNTAPPPIGRRRLKLRELAEFVKARIDIGSCQSAESLGAETNYDANSGTIELTRADDTLRIHVGDRIATLNGKKLTLKTAPFAVRGRGTGLWTATFSLGQFACNNAAIPFITGFTGGILPTIGVLGWLCAAAAMLALIAPLKTPGRQAG